MKLWTKVMSTHFSNCYIFKLAYINCQDLFIILQLVTMHRELHGPVDSGKI